MRVAVAHNDPEHANAGVAAYHFGRVEAFTHPLTGETTSADAIMVALLDQARAEFPESEGYAVWPERLVNEGHTETTIDANGEPVETPLHVWREVDENSLRQRADGGAVDVPLVSDLGIPVVDVATEQDTTAIQEGNN